MVIKLLKDADLGEATLTDAKMELIYRAEKRDQGEKGTEYVPVPVDDIKKLDEVSGK